MDYIENNNEQYFVKKFTKKFISNYIMGVILIGVVITISSKILSTFLPIQIQMIVDFLLTIFGFWKISSSAVETSLKEASINQDTIKKALKNIYIFLIILLVINILFMYIQFHSSVIIFSSLKNVIASSLIAKIIATIIQYAIVMMFCKNKLEQTVLGKEINKVPYIVLLIITIMILCSSAFFNNDSNTSSTKKSVIASKYENANWEEIVCSTTTNVDTNIATVHVSLGNHEKDTIKSYKVVKIVCTIYKKSDNSVIGESETYYEDVDLSYGVFNFSETIRVKLSTAFVGNDFYSTTNAYGVRD